MQLLLNSPGGMNTYRYPGLVELKGWAKEAERRGFGKASRQNGSNLGKSGGFPQPRDMTFKLICMIVCL